MAREIVGKAGETYEVKDKDGKVTVETIPAGMERLRVEVKDRETADGKPNMKEHFYNDYVDVQSWLAALSSGTPEFLTEEFNYRSYAKNLSERASVRAAVVAESTIIKVDGKDVDLMTLPVKSAVKAINGMYAVAAVTGKEPQAAFVVARRKLIDAKTAREDGEVLIAA